MHRPGFQGARERTHYPHIYVDTQHNEVHLLVGVCMASNSSQPDQSSTDVGADTLKPFKTFCEGNEREGILSAKASIEQYISDLIEDITHLFVLKSEPFELRVARQQKISRLMQLKNYAELLEKVTKTFSTEYGSIVLPESGITALLSDPDANVCAVSLQGAGIEDSVVLREKFGQAEGGSIAAADVRLILGDRSGSFVSFQNTIATSVPAYVMACFRNLDGGFDKSLMECKLGAGLSQFVCGMFEKYRTLQRDSSNNFLSVGGENCFVDEKPKELERFKCVVYRESALLFMCPEVADSMSRGVVLSRSDKLAQITQLLVSILGVSTQERHWCIHQYSSLTGIVELYYQESLEHILNDGLKRKFNDRLTQTKLFSHEALVPSVEFAFKSAYPDHLQSPGVLTEQAEGEVAPKKQSVTLYEQVMRIKRPADRVKKMLSLMGVNVTYSTVSKDGVLNITGSEKEIARVRGILNKYMKHVHCNPELNHVVHGYVSTERAESICTFVRGNHSANDWLVSCMKETPRSTKERINRLTQALFVLGISEARGNVIFNDDNTHIVGFSIKIKLSELWLLASLVPPALGERTPRITAPVPESAAESESIILDERGAELIFSVLTSIYGDQDLKVNEVLNRVSLTDDNAKALQDALRLLGVQWIKIEGRRVERGDGMLPAYSYELMLPRGRVQDLMTILERHASDVSPVQTHDAEQYLEVSEKPDPMYHWILSDATLDQIRHYQNRLSLPVGHKDRLVAGLRLAAALNGKSASDLTIEEFVQCLVRTKMPKANSERDWLRVKVGRYKDRANRRFWTDVEVELLSDIAVSVGVTVASTKKRVRILAMAPGLISTHGRIDYHSPDRAKVITDKGSLNEAAYIDLLKSRLLPIFMYVNTATPDAQKAVVSMPGMLCGENVDEVLRKNSAWCMDMAVKQLLSENTFKKISSVFYDSLDRLPTPIASGVINDVTYVRSTSAKGCTAAAKLESTLQNGWAGDRYKQFVLVSMGAITELTNPLELLQVVLAEKTNLATSWQAERTRLGGICAVPKNIAIAGSVAKPCELLSHKEAERIGERTKMHRQTKADQQRAADNVAWKEFCADRMKLKERYPGQKPRTFDALKPYWKQVVHHPRPYFFVEKQNKSYETDGSSVGSTRYIFSPQDWRERTVYRQARDRLEAQEIADEGKAWREYKSYQQKLAAEHPSKSALMEVCEDKKTGHPDYQMHPRPYFVPITDISPKTVYAFSSEAWYKGAEVRAAEEVKRSKRAHEEEPDEGKLDQDESAAKRVRFAEQPAYHKKRPVLWRRNAGPSTRSAEQYTQDDLVVWALYCRYLKRERPALTDIYGSEKPVMKYYRYSAVPISFYDRTFNHDTGKFEHHFNMNDWKGSETYKQLRDEKASAECRDTLPRP
ncbi:MAG: hypothetical protein V4490_01965 [Pseudomonadota bacterium]